jgi:HEAT repeat protein
MFIKLTSDKDWDVRRAAAVSLGFLPEESSVNALLKLFSDSAPEVREAAEDSIIRISPGKVVLQNIAEKQLAVSASRLSAIKVLGSLGYKEAARTIAGFLNASGDESLTVRSIRALGRLDYKPAVDKIATLASDKSPRVRRAVAYALGKLNVSKTYDILISLSRDTEDLPTALAAIEAMGRIGSPVFNDRLAECLSDVNAPSSIRAYACWSAARTGKSSRKMLNQMEKLILKEVIPAEGSKVFDSDEVRISALLALIDIGKKQPSAIKMAKDALEKINPAPSKLIFAVSASSQLKDFARQAGLYMNGVRDIKPEPVPPPSLPVPVRKLK